MTIYRCESVNDGNTSFTVEAHTKAKAYQEALIALGYCLFEEVDGERETYNHHFNPQPKPLKKK